MIGVGEYYEEVGNTKNNQYRLNTAYTSFIKYYQDLKDGKIEGIRRPTNIIVTPNIISCIHIRIINSVEIKILHIATIKNYINDRTVRRERK